MLISLKTYNTRSMSVKTWAVLQRWLLLMEMKSITGTKNQLSSYVINFETRKLWAAPSTHVTHTPGLPNYYILCPNSPYQGI